MKKLLTIIFLVSSICSQAQTVKHHSYITYYDAKIKEPDSVSWDLIPAMVSCGAQARKDAFKADPLIKNSAPPGDYTNSGYDKGHLFCYDDAQCNQVDKLECFYMSNMLPQLHPFNAGDWKVLEMQERVWAKTKKIHIIAGGIGSLGKLKSGENIPAFMFKAILMDGKYICWIMPNKNDSHGHKYDFWEIDKKTFDQRTGLKL